MEWTERYSKEFKEFFASIISWDPDYIVPVARKACKLLKANKEQITLPSNKIFFRKYFEFCKPNVINKKIAIFDDSVNHGTTLYEHRTFFENIGAKVNSYAFVLRESNIKNNLFYGPRPIIGIPFSDQEYFEYLSNQEEFLVSQGDHLDIDHLVLSLELGSAKNLDEIIFILQSIGQLYFIGDSKRNQLKFSLDFPCLFKKEELQELSKFLKFDGVSKIRFFANKDKNTLTICPMIFPTFDANKIIQKADAQIIQDFDIFGITSFKDMIDNNEFIYMCITLQLSALVSSRLLSFLLINNHLSEAIPNLQLNYDDFKQFFGELNGNLIGDKLRFYIQSFSDPKYYRRDYIGISPVYKISQDNIWSDYTDYLWEGYQKAIEKAKTRLNVHYAKTLTEVCSISAQPLEVISELLDFDCDHGIVVPKIENKENKNVWVRSYRTGERKKDIAWERTKLLIPFVISTIQQDLDLEYAGKEVPPLLLTKLLVNFIIDYPHKNLHCFSLDTFLYGAEPLVCNRHTHWEKKFIHTPEIFDNKYIIVKDVNGHTKGFITAKNWDIGWTDRFSEKEEIPESQLHLYFDFLLDIYKRFGQKAEVLNWLAIGRNFEWFYRFPYGNLTLWGHYFARFLKKFNNFDYDDYINGSVLSRSANHCVQAKKKLLKYPKIEKFFLDLISNFNSIPKYKKFISKIEKQYQSFIANNYKIQILSNARKLQHSLSVLVQNTLSNIKKYKYLNKEDPDFNKFFIRFEDILLKILPNYKFNIQEYEKAAKNFSNFRDLIRELYIKTKSYLDSSPYPLPQKEALIEQTLYPQQSLNRVMEIAIQNGIFTPIFVVCDYYNYIPTLKEIKQSKADEYFNIFLNILEESLGKDGIKADQGEGGEAVVYIFDDYESVFHAIALCYDKFETENKSLEFPFPPYKIKFGVAKGEINPPDDTGLAMLKYKLAVDCANYKKRIFSNNCIVPEEVFNECPEALKPYFEQLEGHVIPEHRDIDYYIHHNLYDFKWKALTQNYSKF